MDATGSSSSSAQVVFEVGVAGNDLRDASNRGSRERSPSQVCVKDDPGGIDHWNQRRFECACQVGYCPVLDGGCSLFVVLERRRVFATQLLAQCRGNFP